MATMFEVTEGDIERLDAVQLTGLLLRLMTLEAARNHLPLSGVTGTTNITKADGGQDARIEWSGGTDRTDWFPKRSTMFQCKATDTSPGRCEAEMIDAKSGDVKTRVDEVLAAGGAYILFCTTACTGTMEQDRIDAFRRSLRARGKAYADTAEIQVYGAGHVVRWANQHISAITAIKRMIGQPLPDGVLTWSEWSGFQDHSTQFVKDDPLKDYIGKLRGHLAAPRHTARILGLPGVGKTRLALEAFRPPNDADTDARQQALSDSAVYVDAAFNTGSLPELLWSFVRSKLSGIVVVDNCDRRVHDALQKTIEHDDSQLSLLTLDYSIDEEDGDVRSVRLLGVSDEVIRGIIEQTCPGLTDAQKARVVEFAQGFAGMAVMIAQALLADEPDYSRLRNDLLVDKLIWQRSSPNPEARRVIVACSIFEQLGCEDDVANQRAFVAERICRMDRNDFYRHVQDFRRRKIIDQRGRYVRVVPFPLAITLATEWWKGCPTEHARELFQAEMPPGMAEALCKQLGLLHHLPQAREIAGSLCRETGPFGRAEALLTEQGSQLFRALVPANPEECTAALNRVLRPLSTEQLLEVGPARRNLVWALEALCFRPDTFPVAARLMLALGAAENESWGNNATNMFCQLYHVYLSGTQVPPLQRLPILDEALTSNSLPKQSLAVRALGSALDTHHFMRMGGVERLGARAPEEDWAPSNKEDVAAVAAYQETAIARLADIACERPPLSDSAMHELAERIRGLISAGRLDALERAIRRVSGSKRGFWPEALHGIRQAIEYEGEGLPREILDLIRSWEALLAPEALSEQLRLVVSIPDWEHVEDAKGGFIDMAAQRAEELAGRVAARLQELLAELPIIMQGEQRQAFGFGMALAARGVDRDIVTSHSLDALRSIPSARGNPSFLCGFLRGLNDHQYVSAFLDRVAAEPALCPYLAELTRLTEPTEADLDRVIRVAREGRLPVAGLRSFAYNSVLAHLASDATMRFTNRIAELSTEGTACALELLYMYCHGNKERWGACIPAFRAYVMTPGLLSEINRNPMFRGHNWDAVACGLLKPGRRDEELAAAVAVEIAESCRSEDFSHDSRHFVSKVLAAILGDYFDVAWPVIGAVLLGDEPLAIHRLGYLLGGMGSKEETGAVLSQAPLPQLLRWCRGNAPKAARTLARYLPVVRKNPDESYDWHEFAMAMLDEFGDDERFLRGISGNLFTFTWWGSLVPYYERLRALMGRLLDHRHERVRTWARDSIRSLEENVTEARKEDDEEAFGIR